MDAVRRLHPGLRQGGVAVNGAAEFLGGELVAHGGCRFGDQLGGVGPDGLGALMRGFSLRRVVGGALTGLLPLAAFCLAAGSWALLIASLAAFIAGTLLATFLMGAAYGRAIGGFTGDSLGAATEWGEIATLLILGIVLRFYGTIII